MLEILLSVIVYNKRQLTVSDILNRHDIIYNHAHSDNKEDDDFLSLKKLLIDTRKAQER